MQDNYTHICIVLDASGSMSHIENDTKGSINNFIKSQKDLPGKATMDLYQFADSSHKIVDFVDLGQFNDDVMGKYHCSGCTALNDAICQAIDETGKKLADMEEKDRPSKVSFVILTDGFENASQKFTSTDVKNRIQHQTDVYKWDFVYLAANQDAFETGESMGFSSSRCLNISACEVGDMKHNMDVVRCYSRAIRMKPAEANCMCMADFEMEVDEEEKKSKKNSTRAKGKSTTK